MVVTELSISETQDVLRAATYGWGMWQRRIRQPFQSVDVYVRNNRMDTGETNPAPTHVVDPQILGSNLYFWESPDIKVSFDGPAPQDGVEFDELPDAAPVLGAANPLYIQVHNRGWEKATNVKVKALWAGGAAGLPGLPNDFWSSFPDHWSAATDWQPIDPNVPFQTIDELLPHTPAILTWSWSLPLSAPDDSCVLVVISAEEDPVTLNDANPDHLIVDPISVSDKHVAHRNMHPAGLQAGGQSSIKSGSFNKTIELNNPYRVPDFFTVEIDRGTLPKRANAEVKLPRTAPTHHDAKRVLIPARSKVTAKVSLSLPDTVRPGDEFRFSIIQRRKGQIMGGSTYLVRVPPAVVRVSNK